MKNRDYLPLLIFATLAIGIFLGTLLNFPVPESNNHKNKLNKLIDLINSEYVDKVDTDSIVDLTVTNILDKLDPHSVYIAKEEMQDVSQSMKGDFVGIGVSFYVQNDTVIVIKPIENGPSEKAGILSGDRILFADKTKLFGKKISSDSMFFRLRGEVGSKVALTVFRKSNNKKLKINVIRDVVAIKSVDVAQMLNKTTGYIKINRFAATTYDEFKKSLLSLKKQGAKTMVIDVRDNGGGYMEKAIEIADEFLKKGQLIVFTKNQKNKIEKTFATANGIFETGNVYVLINENSASASEILAGAIQDNDRGTIIGRRSFGKGLVQKEVNFDDGSAVRLTIARYYTPTGRSIQKSYKKGNLEYFKDYGQRYENGELYKKDSIKIIDSVKFVTPKGKIVYGGGGIIPDVFVPLGSKKGDEAIAYLSQSNLLQNFVFSIIDKNRNDFQQLDYESVVTKINNSTYLADFKKFLLENGLELKLDQNKDVIKTYMIAEFSRQLFGENKYYEIILKSDPMVRVILEGKGI